jgi:hypothetical protein
MSERIWKCPNCGAALSPSRFAREATCSYCKTVVQIDETSVSAQLFRDAYSRWNAPREGDGRAWFAVGGEHWTTLALLARGEIADVYLAERARWPPERALLKVLREAADLPMLDLEWNALHALRELGPRVPDPIARGSVEGGPHSGAQAELLRWVPGFEHTLEEARAAFPAGIDAHAAVWIWRRLLEALGFLHEKGIVHGAVLPQHLLVEQGEHGLRLVGFGCADRPGAPLAAVVSRYEAFYPRDLLERQELQPAHDLSMSARCIAFALGSAAPDRLRALLEAVAAGKHAADARALHGQLGTLARELFGPPSFHPLVLPQPR